MLFDVLGLDSCGGVRREKEEAGRRQVNVPSTTYGAIFWFYVNTDVNLRNCNQILVSYMQSL